MKLTPHNPLRRASVISKKMQFAYDKPRVPAFANGTFRCKLTSKYAPHQGKEECARRVAQMTTVAKS
jgi:hypothetical protein